jgi:hypothetical protein
MRYLYRAINIAGLIDWQKVKTKEASGDDFCFKERKPGSKLKT